MSPTTPLSRAVLDSLGDARTTELLVAPAKTAPFQLICWPCLQVSTLAPSSAIVESPTTAQGFALRRSAGPLGPLVAPLALAASVDPRQREHVVDQAAQRRAIEDGQHHIERDQIVVVVVHPYHGQAAPALVSTIDRVAGSLEPAPQRSDEPALVFD